MIKTIDQLLNEARSRLPRRLTPAETWQEIIAGTLVIDIREDERLRQDGLIPRSLVIRRNVLEWRCDPLSQWHHPRITHHQQKLVLFCNEGFQSSLAAATLQDLGLEHATDMIDGFSGWKQSGLPVVAYEAAESSQVEGLGRDVW
jgi:rhodanese-related sulfurtransferase